MDLKFIQILISNVCLKKQLIYFYIIQIRKRKLEKADILELTVKHLMHLQNTKRGLCSIGISLHFQHN